MAHTVTALSKSTGTEVSRVSGTTTTVAAVQYGLGPNKPISVGALKMTPVRVDVTAYVTGGVTITPESAGLNAIAFISILDPVVQNGAAFHIPRVTNADPTKIQLFTTAGAEVANGADGGDFRIAVWGQ